MCSPEHLIGKRSPLRDSLACEGDDVPKGEMYPGIHECTPLSDVRVIELEFMVYQIYTDSSG
jgi:hypothetical protein